WPAAVSMMSCYLGVAAGLALPEPFRVSPFVSSKQKPWTLGQWRIVIWCWKAFYIRVTNAMRLERPKKPTRRAVFHFIRNGPGIWARHIGRRHSTLPALP